MPFDVADENVMVVRQATSFRTLINNVKKMLREQSHTIELQAVDDESYATVSQVSECLLDYKYVTLNRLNKETHHTPMKKVMTTAADCADVEMEEKPKLVIHLTKTEDFDEIYDGFELAL